MGFVKSLSMILCLHGCFLVPLSGATITFLVIETGLPVNRPVQEFSRLWESTLMDVFFDAGHIVSNAPIMQLKAISKGVFPDEAQGELKVAIAGGSDFFILALLEYQDMTEGAPQRPQLISLKLFSTKPYRCVVEQQYQKAISISGAEELREVKKAARTFLVHLGR
ncbi:MAG: hypothetical protein LBD93_03150 [Treponema sp.]|jgi:hypothetical protein|nr:hypothetical protein [Treponema sp.]